MSTYFIGDVHGCYDELMRLLARIQFNHERDRLIFVGDLINRGPQSLQVLRLVRLLGDSAQVVLGNHDISLLAYAAGIYHGKGSDFPEMMQADDADDLLDWLRSQPLLIHDELHHVVVTHAGIPPRWSLEQAKKHARKAEKKLQSDNYVKYLRKAYQKKGHTWSADFDKYDKFRYRINGFTRLRYCNAQGEPDFSDKCPVGEQQAGLLPWFEMRKKQQNDADTRVIFGHWAALGYHFSPHAICIDSGCVWGGQLTAISLRDHVVERTQINASRRKSKIL